MAAQITTTPAMTETVVVNPNANVVEDVMQKIYGLLAEYGLKIVAALLILVIGLWVAKFISKFLGKQLGRTKIDPTLVSFIHHLVHGALVVFVIIAALAKVGIETTSFIAVLGAAGLAVGFALQGSLSNFAAGILLIIYKPFRVGDFVELSGKLGTIREIQMFNTIMDSPENARVVVPNSHATDGAITNFTVNGSRRVDLVIGISYGDDIKKAQQVMRDVLASDQRVLAEPVPTVAVSELGESSVNFVVRPWVKPADYWDIYFGMTEKIKLALDANDITIPFPQRDVHIKND